ncbi:MAG: metal ABC transporter ATP-binding protein [Candidatus Methanomethylicota archaeon]|uniref:Metal ABC transporter ATP-binding protein n=1 Tax=Thermoproteota archaeon TaxID=2056631 RepID=A0A497ET21_9CREN|nr:MAG: metal ABC transporter ATP-binding protein [Candidatus Verstraetearchaeota archaeon]RLE53588.1 MAG: metal ABC transporter ATP-binding protein [Candidatus Verstraetearchaeota archaeon]
MTYVVEAKDLTIAYDSSVALKDINFSVEHPTFLAIIGPNGAGKSTLLRAMLGQLKILRGELKVMGIDVKENPRAIRRMVGYVPQRERINFEVPLKVKDVILMGLLTKLKPPRIPRRSDLEAAKKALEAVGLEDLWNESFAHLSGGQQQRVLIARAMVSDPTILLLDEPFSGVDTKSYWEIITVLRSLRLKDKSIILVTHDINPIVDCIDKVLLLNKRIIAYGTPREVLTERYLVEAYGPSVRVIEHKGLCFAITGDVHA